MASQESPVPVPEKIEAAPWLDAPDVQAVFAAIAAGGFECRAVGGAVRNTLMGLPVRDIDLATDAGPDEVIRLAEAAGLAAHPTGVEHGTVTVVSGKTPIEVTSLRADVETFGRRARVAFTKDWVTDASRRDFTINAIYCAPDGQLFDPLCGLADIAARRVRFIDDAEDRIREDYLRILRFFRFSAEHGNGELDAEGLRASIRLREGLAEISSERIRNELFKLLVAPGAAPVVSVMAETGILSRILATAPRVTFFCSLIDRERALAVTPAAIRRLAALALHGADDSPRLAHRLRLSNEDRDRLMKMAGFSALNIATDADVRASIYRLDRTAFEDRALLDCASGRQPDEGRVKQALDLAASWQPPQFPLSGGDLLAGGRPPGPEVGELLRVLENQWIASDFTLSKEALLTISRM